MNPYFCAMRKIFVLCTISALAFFASCKNNGKTSIRGKIANAKDGKLIVIKDDAMTQTDTIDIKDGKFDYEVQLTEPTPLYLLLQETGENVLLFADNSSMELNGAINDFKNSKISGGKTHKIFQSYLTDIDPMIKKAMGLAEQMANAKSEEEANALQAEYSKLDSTETTIMKSFIAKNPTSPVSSFLASSKLSQNVNPAVVQEMYGLLKGEALQTSYGKKLTESFQKLNLTNVGASAPDFSLATPDGKMIALSSYKGKYVLVDFWASWCKPCREENPNVVKAYQTFHGKGFEVLGVSLDDSKSNWQEAITEDGLSWTHISDLKGWENQAAKMYGIQSIPSNLLVGPDGKIIAKDLRGAALQAKLSEIYK
jgi:peroxiredoxin